MTRTKTVMVRFTEEEHARVEADAKGKQIAVYVRRRALEGTTPDPDPRVVEVRTRNPSGRFDLRLGVFTASRAAGMQALYEAKGWTVTLTPVAEQPKVGADLPDPQEQIAALTIKDITAARLRDEARITTKRKP